ncbi:MAG: O-antigen ligase family protein [Bryobacteraceae bacterium]
MSLHFGAEGSLGILLYVGAIAAILGSIFWRPVLGIFYLAPLIPLQTARYRLNVYPLGASVVTIVLVAVAIGVMRTKRPLFPKTPWTKFIAIYTGFTFLSLILGSMYLGGPLPLPGSERFSVWADYMMMAGLLLLVAAVEPSRRQMKFIVILMCLSMLALDRNFLSTVSDRDFSAFSYDLRDAGSVGYAGINGMAALEAQFATFLLALAAFEKNLLFRIGYYALAVMSAICLMYSLSRGGYVAMLAGWAFLGLAKKRWMLVALIAFIFTWTTLVPNAVRERVTMTYESGGLDHSSETRVTLWEDALQVFDSNVILGSGFNTYAYMHRVGNYEDTHNFFLKVLVETGVFGLGLFLWLLGKTFRVGLAFSRRAKDPFYASLGLGLAGWLVAAFFANLFGDRWNYLQICGYMWVIAGMVAHAMTVEDAEPEEDGAEAEMESPLQDGAVLA